MEMRFIVVCCTLFLSSVLARAADCPAKQSLSAKSLNPESFQAWLKSNSASIKTVEDLVCCLPQNYLKNYVVSYAGHAGQNGSPESPRVFLFNTNKYGSSILTFNGGEAYLNDPLNVEFGFINEHKKFDIYDIEFYKRFAQISEKNPVRCLRCHGDSNGEARPFFHMYDPATLVTGAPACSELEDQIQNKAQTLALQSIIENPRYRCLDRGIAQSTLASEHKTHRWTGAFSENLKHLQGILSEYERARLARFLRDSPSYENYKYALVGAELCPEFKPREWLPEEVASHHNVMSGVDSAISSVESKEDLAKAIAKLKREANWRSRNLKHLLESDFELSRGSFLPAFQSWLCGGGAEKFEFRTEGSPSTKNYQKFRLDTVLRVFPSNSDAADKTASLRYLLDGRGVDTSTWTLTFNSKEDLIPFLPVASELVALEPSKSALKAVFPNIKKRDPTSISSSSTEKICEKLKDLSLQSFQRQTPLKMR